MADVPADLKYTKDHEWARIDGHRVTVGITQHAVDQLGDVTLVGLDVKVGGALTAAKPFGTVESVKAVSDLFAPVTGTLVEVNASLNSNPEKVNESPYDAGWMVVIEVADASALGELLDASDYRAYLG